MNFFNIIFRSKTKTSIKAFETWEVRWKSRNGNYYNNTRPEVRVFTNKDDAKEFASALRDAFKLIKHTSGNDVYVEYRNSN